MLTARRNEQEQSLVNPPPVRLPGPPHANDLAMTLLWEYAEGGWVDRGEILRHQMPADPEDWYLAEDWLEEEELITERDVDDDGFARAQPTPLGWAMLRWWGWEDVERAGNPAEICPGDFVVIREPETRRFHVLACGRRDCLTLVGPEGGASSPSSAAMWARRIGGADARVWLIETREMAFPISRAANALVAKERLRAVV